MVSGGASTLTGALQLSPCTFFNTLRHGIHIATQIHAHISPQVQTLTHTLSWIHSDFEIHEHTFMDAYFLIYIYF